MGQAVSTATRGKAAVWVALIDQGRCVCPGCEGKLATPGQYPSWRRCMTCGCHWTVSDVHGQRREGVFADPRCPARRPADLVEDGPPASHGGRGGVEPVAAAGSPTSRAGGSRPACDSHRALALMNTDPEGG